MRGLRPVWGACGRILLSAAAVALAVAVGSGSARGAEPGDEADVRRALGAFVGALNDLRWDDFRAWFADDVTLFNPEIPEVENLGRIEGREAVERSFRKVFDAARRGASGPPYLHIVPRNVRVQMLDHAAVATFEFDRDGGTIGRRTLVFRRSPGGWRIVHIHASNTTRRE
jgi:ketosteroid isomerase-like protein